MEQECETGIYGGGSCNRMRLDLEIKHEIELTQSW